MKLLERITGRLPARAQVAGEAHASEGASPESLEAVLISLQRYGQPRVGVYGNDGLWHCTVKAHVNAVGASFDVSSDFKHATPLEAATVCRQRLRDAIKQMTGGEA